MFALCAIVRHSDAGDAVAEAAQRDFSCFLLQWGALAIEALLTCPRLSDGGFQQVMPVTTAL
jgi:hypothetical protein